MKGFLKSEDDISPEDINPLEGKYPKKKKFQVFGPKKKEYDYKVPEGPMKTGCQCQMSENQNVIFCDKHQCTKTKSLYSLCKTREDYFKMWEDGRGPMQDNLSKMMLEKRPQEIKYTEQENQDSQDVTGEGFFMNDLDIPSESRGLGDTLAKITKATGIKKVVDTVFGAINKDCGCRERQSKLNKIFPYKKEEGAKKKTKGFFE